MKKNAFEEKQNTSTQLIIRQANLLDAAKISELVLSNARETLFEYYSPVQWEVFKKYYSPEAVIEKMKTQTIFCGVLDEQLVGTVALENAFVLGFYTHTGYLGKGIGSKMMEYLEKEAKAKGISELELAASPVGVAYYLKHGWEKVNEEDFIYEGVLFRETRMRKRL